MSNPIFRLRQFVETRAKPFHPGPARGEFVIRGDAKGHKQSHNLGADLVLELRIHCLAAIAWLEESEHAPRSAEAKRKHEHVCRRIRELDAAAQRIEYRVRNPHVRVAGVVVLPCSLRTLVRTLRESETAILQCANPNSERSSAASAERPEIRLTIDSCQRCAYYGETRLAINANAEFAVLFALESELGNVVSYESLWKAISAESCVKTAGSMGKRNEAPPLIKDAVSRIRRALKVSKCPYRIENIRRTGYRLSRVDMSHSAARASNARRVTRA
jgi:DNA-binding response OmpR family regulator